MKYENTSLWQNTLGKREDEMIDRLRVSYLSLREHMKGLLEEVRQDFPNLTVHSIEHSDDLWRIASLITGNDYPLTPLEGYILGCSFLVHDSILSYKAFGGKEELRKSIEWEDYYQDIIGTEYDNEEGKQKIDFNVLRKLHAYKCEDILKKKFTGLDGNDHYLLTDDELRQHYGDLIGVISASHHWETSRLTELPHQVNPIGEMPSKWIICPLKIACILRCADAAAIDSNRAPDYIVRLLQLNGVSKDHWLAQNRLGIALDLRDSSRLVIASTQDFQEKDFEAWNVAYDAVKVIDEELGKCNELLADFAPFRVRGVAGSKSRKSLASYIKTKGWMPSDVCVHVSDVAKLIMTLGGKELYGKEDLQLIVLRELIQNARDAIQARRLLEKDEAYIGKIQIDVKHIDEDTQITVTDNGVGMSLDTITGSLLNFGQSFWHEKSVHTEFPGLKKAGFKSIGQYGIGFFSVFMVAKSVIVETRKYCDGLKDAHLVKFPKGLTLAPLFATYTSTSTVYTTKIKLILNDKYKEWPIEYEVKRNLMNASNINVPMFAMLSTLVSGLDVDVYYKEFEKPSRRIHQQINASDFDKKAWLRALSFADYQQDQQLDNYIEANYNRLEYIKDEHNEFAGLAAIGTRFFPHQDFLGGTTVGGLLTGLHSRSGEYWIGIFEKRSSGAKREGRDFVAPSNVLLNWANKQAAKLEEKLHADILSRYRLQIAMQSFKADPIKLALAVVLPDRKNTSSHITLELGDIVKILLAGKKLIFIDSYFVSKKENEGHGDVHFNYEQVGRQLNDDEMLFVPLFNTSFLSYKLIDGVPEKNYGFIDCLYRTAEEMGYKLLFSYKQNYIRNGLGMEERALVIEAENLQ